MSKREPNDILESKYVCHLCDRILKQPIYLRDCSTCNINICKEHLNKPLTLNNKRYECPNCLGNNETLSMLIIVNKSLQLQIENYEYLSDEKRVLKLNFEQNFERFEEILSNLKVKICGFSLKQADHFENLRRDVDIKRESLIQDIYLKRKSYNDLEFIQTKSNDMIKQIVDFENEFRSNFEKKIKPNLLNFDLEKERKNMEEILRRPSFFSSLENQLNLFEKKFWEIEKNSKNFKLFEYDLKRNTFENEKEDEKNLGRFVLFKNFINNVNEPILNLLINNYEYEPKWRNRLSLLNLNTNSIVKSLTLDNVMDYTMLGEDSTKVVSYGKIFDIQIWNFADHQKTCIKTFKHIDVYCVKVISLNRLASGADNGSIKIWELTSANCMQTLIGHEMRVLDLVQMISEKENDDLLLSASLDDTIRFWDLTRNSCIKKFKGCNFKFIRAIKNNLFASVDNSSYYGDSKIKIWNFCTGLCEKILIGHTSFINFIIFYSGKNQLISCSNDKTIRLWDMKMFRCIHVIDSLEKPVDLIILNPNNTNDSSQQLLAFFDKFCYLLDLNTGKVLQNFKLETDYNRVLFCTKNQHFL